MSGAASEPGLIKNIGDCSGEICLYAQESKICQRDGTFLSRQLSLEFPSKAPEKG